MRLRRFVDIYGRKCECWKRGGAIVFMALQLMIAVLLFLPFFVIRWRCEFPFYRTVVCLLNTISSLHRSTSVNTPTKTKAWVYVEEHHLDQAEWFCKVDYDTYFFPDNLKYFVRQKHWNPYTEYHYFGHLIQHRTRKDEPMIVGAAACWSRKTLDDIADVYRTMPKGSKRGERGRCEDRAHATEEVTTSQCLREHLNVTAYAARDEELREYITIDDYARVLTWNRTEQGEW